MRGAVIAGFVLTFLALFVFSSWLFDHLSPRFRINAVPPVGMDDSVFEGYLNFHCPSGVGYDLHYSFPTTTAVSKIQLMVEGRAVPIDLCRPSPGSPGTAPLCPAVSCTGVSCYRGRLYAKNVPIPICQKIEDSHPQVRVIAFFGPDELARGSLVRHATE